MTYAEIGMKTEKLEFSVRNGTDILAENSVSEIIKIGEYVRIIFMMRDLKFHVIPTPEK